MGGLPDYYPGYQRVTDPEACQKFAALYGMKPLPARVGLTETEMFEAAVEGRLRAMYIFGENPALSDPNTEHIMKSLHSNEFLVAQDIFVNETAAEADVVLPAAAFAEKDGTFTSSERRVQRVRQALTPPGQAFPDWQIVCALARRMGMSE